HGAYLLLLVPMVCCGGPVIFAALAATSVVILGAVGAIVGVTILAIVLVLSAQSRRRTRWRQLTPTGRCL
ncbi:MAG: hypothetical protein ACP5O0_09175, partial [Acidimicrobiales bacterium]